MYYMDLGIKKLQLCKHGWMSSTHEVCHAYSIVLSAMHARVLKQYAVECRARECINLHFLSLQSAEKLSIFLQLFPLQPCMQHCTIHGLTGSNNTLDTTHWSWVLSPSLCHTWQCDTARSIDLYSTFLNINHKDLLWQLLDFVCAFFCCLPLMHLNKHPVLGHFAAALRCCHSHKYPTFSAWSKDCDVVCGVEYGR